MHPRANQNPPSSPPGQGPAGAPGRRRGKIRACGPCHNSKRRCSSTYPCENCEATGKTCVYYDADGRNISASITPSSARADEGQPFIPTDPPQLNSRRASSSGRSIPTAGQLELIIQNIDIDPNLCRELLNLFFSHVHPYSCMFHQPTFWGALMAGDIPIYLLNAMFAITAPLCQHPSIQPVSAPSQPPTFRTSWKAGGRFAESALQQLLERGTNDVNVARFPNQEIYVAQALMCLSFWDASARRKDSQPRPFMRQAVRILASLTPPQWYTQESRSARANQGTASDRSFKAAWIREECLRRTIWITHWVTMLASAVSLSPRRWEEMELRMPLPIDEGVFDLSITDSIAPEYLVPGRSPSLYISDFAHLIRMCAIYSSTMAYLGERSELARRRLMAYGRPGSSSAISGNTSTFRSLKAALANWSSALPRKLQLTESNINDQLASRDLGNGMSSWAFALMHSLSACVVLGLHAALEIDGDMPAAQAHAEEKEQVYQTLIAILSRMRDVLRPSLFSLAPLAHIGGYGPQSDQASASRALNNPIIRDLLREFEEQWGLSPWELLSVDYRTRLVKNVLAASETTASASGTMYSSSSSRGGR